MILKMFGSQTKVVTDLQETLVILADVLLWKQLVQQLLSQYKEKSGLNFEEIKAHCTRHLFSYNEGVLQPSYSIELVDELTRNSTSIAIDEELFVT